MLLIVAAVVMVAGILIVWFGVRWQLGDMFPEVTSESDRQAAEIAETAIGFAPSNPRGYWLSGAILKSAFDELSVEKAIERFETAARVAPNRYTSWTELGRVYELAGRFEDAELAFVRAVELAPEYTLPRWQIGNFYLRRGRLADSVRELRYASVHNSPYRIQVFSLAWNVLGQDPQQVEQFLSDDDESKAALASFYGIVNRPDDALRIWSTIDPSARVRFRPQIEVLARELLWRRSYRGALEFSRQAGLDPDARPEAITNGDFESPIKTADLVNFDWKLNRLDGKVDISTDSSTWRGGKRSLRFTLRGYLKPEFRALSQSVAVQPGASYRLSYWLRTEDLHSGSMPLIEIRNAVGDSLNTVSPSFPSGTHAWQEVGVDFDVPANSDGIYLLTAREPCSDECPITGIFWLDSFELIRLQ